MGHDRDLLDRVRPRREAGHEGVAGLVVGDRSALVGVGQAGLPGAQQQVVEGFLELLLADHFAVLARRQEGRLVGQVGEVGAGQARGRPRDNRQVDVGARRSFFVWIRRIASRPTRSG